MLSLLILPALIAPAPDGRTVLAPDTESRWVAFELTPYNQIRFPIEIDGRPARAILDTGLSDTVATSDFARDAGIRTRQSVNAVAIGGSVPVAWASGIALRFGGLTRSGGRIGVVNSGEQARFGADLLVGSDVLGCCALDIDFERRRFRILPSGRMPFTGDTARLARSPGSGIYVASVTLAGKRLTPIVVDTGDGAALTLSTPAWQSVGYRESRITTTLGWGMGGALVTDTAIVPSLVLAGGAPVETEVRVEPAGGFIERIGAAGRLGTGMMLRFRVLLDPMAGHMVLAPRADAPGTAIRSTSGLLVTYAEGALRIVHVMRDSPAAQAGLRAGETICTADGTPVAEQVDAQGLVEWTAGTPGRVLDLGLCDGTRRTLTLARFY
ncbi:aspartyl protease family protein [Sphingomonas sp. CJ20]